MQRLSVLVIHNRYQQPGGEDAVVRAECDLLRRAGHRVVEYMRDNRSIARYGLLRRAALFVGASWNRQTYRDLRQLMLRERPDIAHCHNFLPLVSPAAYYACKAADVPVVQTLHNYRLVCPGGTMFRNGNRCPGCGPNKGRAILGRCYRDSGLQTGAVALMLNAHRYAGTWEREVGAYIAPSAFCRDVIARAGFPANRFHVKPNFLAHDPAPRTSHGSYALFVGRLSPEKGVLELIRAWSQINGVPLLIAGGGPLMRQAEELSAANYMVKLLGQLDSQQTTRLMKDARFLIVPSRWDEPFGMVLVEAAACGVPVIASRVGAVPEIVTDGDTGLLFDPDDPDDLIERVQWAWLHPRTTKAMGAAARERYLERFTAEKNYEMLMQIYTKAMA